MAKDTLQFWISLETKSLLTWEGGAVRLTGVLYVPALRLLRLYMYHEKIICSSFTLKEYPSISQPLSDIFLSNFTVCSPFPLFKFQGPRLSLVKNREYSYGPWIVARSASKSIPLM